MIKQDNVNSKEPLSKTLLLQFANRHNLNLEAADVWGILVETCFPKNPTDAQMVTFLLIANEYGLNPFTKEIYAFVSTKGNKGIIPIVSVDGWSNIITKNGKCNGIEFRWSEEELTITTSKGDKTAHKWCECIIHRTDQEHPVVVREYLTEVYKT